MSELLNTRLYRYKKWKSELASRRVIVFHIEAIHTAKIVHCSDSSRYFKAGRARIKARIYQRLGNWTNVPGVLLTLTFDPKLISKETAWAEVGKRKRAFLNRLNLWRHRMGYTKLRSLSVLEEQTLHTGYPHIHLVFPGLKWVAPIQELTKIWGQASNSVDISLRDNFSPTAYICKYITKMDGWSEAGEAFLWENHLRLYSYARDYILPQLAARRAPEWRFSKVAPVESLGNIYSLLQKYCVVLGYLYKEDDPGIEVHTQV